MGEHRIIFPLEGNGDNKFDLELALGALDLIQERLPKRGIHDKYTFQIYLRALATIYYFLGGDKFSTALSSKLHRRFSEEEIENWMTAEDSRNAPRYGVRRQAIDRAHELVQSLIKAREAGISLFDITSTQY